MNNNYTDKKKYKYQYRFNGTGEWKDVIDIEIKAYKQGQRDLLEEVEKHFLPTPGLTHRVSLSKKYWRELKEKYG